MATDGLTAFLDFSHCFGAKAGIRDNVVHTSESVVAYPAGRHLCSYNTESREMSFIVQPEHVESMTAMAVSHNRKYIAVCERLMDGGGQVTIYNAASEKRVRTLTHPDSKQFTALAFSVDSKFLVTVDGAPDYTLVYWNWYQSKVIASQRVNTQVKRVSFSPLDNVQLATSGPGLLKLWRLQENSLKGFNLVSGKAAMQTFADHAWAPGERLLAVTENGDVLVIEQGELQGTIKSRLAGETINTIAVYSSGFIIAGSGTIVSVYEKNDAKDRAEERELYHHFKTFKSADSLGEVTSLSLAPGEENLAVLFSSNQVATFPIASVDILKEEQNHFQFLGSGFHAGAITSISVCVRKPLVATCGTDRSVRIWNYLDKTCEVRKTFPDELSAIAIHPSGFQLLLGFSDKLRLFNVLIEDLRQYQEFPVKACKQVKFSNGGHLFAAVNVSNIVIYSTYTFEKLGVLISHTALVKSICWSPDDMKLASAGIDGAVYEWSLQGYSRVEENVSRNVHYSCVVYNQAGSGVVACGDDRKITEFIKSSAMREVNIPSSRVQQLLISNSDKVLVAGTAEGTVSAMVWGSEGAVKEGTPLALAEGITALGVTHDDCILFVGTEDGMLFQFDIHLMENGEVLGVTPEDPSNFLDVVLVTRADMEEKTTAMADLENKIGEIQVQSEYKLHLHDQDWNDKTKKMKEEMEAGRVAAEGRFEALRRRKEQQELEAVEAIQNMERAHMKAAEELEALYEKKLAIEAQRYRGLLHEKEDLECSYEEQLEITKSKYNSVILKLKGEYEAKTKEQQDGFNRLRDELANTKAQFEEFVSQQDEDHEDEMLKMRQQNARALEEEQETVVTLKSQSAIMRRRFETHRNEMEQLKGSLKQREDELKLAGERAEEQGRQIQMLKSDIRDREHTIDNKEKRISELRMKAKELEKIKFVLDYKYKELKQEIEPKETQILHMKEQIKEMDEELERDVRTNHALGQALNDKTQKIDNLNNEIKRQRAHVQEKERVIQLFVTDLEKLVTEVDPAYWRDAIRQLYRTYVKKGSKEAGSRDVPDSMDEFARQREYMERSLTTLKKRAGKNEEAMQVNNHKKAAENAMLIDELNALRRDKRMLESKVSELTVEMQTMRGGGGGKPTRGGDSPSLSQSVASQRRSLAGSQRTESPAPATSSAGRPGTQSGMGSRLRGSQRSEQIWSERAKVQGLLEQLDENSREIEGQRYEIKRLREQVQALLARAPLEDAAGAATLQLTDQARSNTAPPPRGATATPLGGGRRPGSHGGVGRGGLVGDVRAHTGMEE